MSPIPSGAPTTLSLYALVPDVKPRAASIYLCNPGIHALNDLRLRIRMIAMRTYYETEPARRWDEPHWDDSLSIDCLPARTCVLINDLDPVLWDIVNHYSLTFTNGAGRWQTQADDLALNAFALVQNPELVWVPFGPLTAV